jgi:hypothetical protein
MNIFTKTYHEYLKNLINNLVPKNQISNYIIYKNSLAYTNDVQNEIQKAYKESNVNSRIVVIFFNFLWKPVVDLLRLFKLLTKKHAIEPNWLSKDDLSNLFYLENFEKIKEGNKLSLFAYQIYRPIIKPLKKYSISIIIPARNESGNINGLLSKLPKFGNKIDVIFVEGHSKDDTYQKIKTEITNNNRRDIKAVVYKQKGVGKNDAVKLGFSKAKNDILMILDADLTVKPKELIKFYNVIAENKADLVIGTRLVYPMEQQAMRMLNYFGNKIFSIIFSFIIDQKIKDTLCGTKVILRKNYELIKKNQKYFGDFDPFGDFDLIFGGAMLNFKIIEIPIRYGQRMYGETNISRFKHGLLLFKMAIIGLLKLKFR